MLQSAHAKQHLQCFLCHRLTGMTATSCLNADCNICSGFVAYSNTQVTLSCCRVRSEAEAQKHMRRRRKRKREKISKAQGAADSAEQDPQAAASAAGVGDDAAGKEEEDEKLTAADELAPMQVSSQCHLTSPRLQCCTRCLALCQHAFELVLHAQWVCMLQSGPADTCGLIPRMCMHQYATSVRVTAWLHEVSVDWQPNGSGCRSLPVDHRCWCPLPEKAFWG